MKVYKLLYKVGYRHSPMWKYNRFIVKADTLIEAKRKLKKSHPKATKFTFVEVL